MPTSFAILLRQHRIEAGLTQEELAERARLSARAVSDLERGGNRTPRIHTVRQLANALPLSPAQQQALLDASRVERHLAVNEDGGRVSAPVGDGLPGTDAARSTKVARPEQPLPVGGFLGAIPSGPLVAREQELARILAMAELAQAGQGRLVALAGEPGAGKTRLAQEVSLILSGRGFLVATGSCYEAQQASPYFPFLDLLTVLYHRAPDDLRVAVPQRFPYLALLLPDQHLPVPGPAREGAEDQERLFWSVVGFIQAWAERQPLALLLDDVHWSDHSSLELLQRLARHTRDHAVLLLATYRDVEVGRRHPLQAALRELTRQELLERIAVRHLGEEGTAQLVATVFNEHEISAEFAILLYERTEGNPFLVQQVLRVLVERGDVYREEDRWTRKAIRELEVPESIRSAVGQRVDRLTEEAQQILDEASVLGQTFHFDDLLAMVEHEEPSIELALEEALQMGLIRGLEGDHYAFDHALTQQALYGELNARKRRRLHLAAGRTLERLPDRKRSQRIAELVWHFQQGDDPERALRYALQAGKLAEEIYAYQEAERHYRTALALAHELEDRRSEAEAGEKLAFVLTRLNRWSEALPPSEDALALYHALEDIEGEMRAARVTCLSWPPHRKDQIIPRLEHLLDRAPATPSTAQARLAVELAGAYMFAGRLREGIALVQKAITLAGVSGDGQAEQEALHYLAVTYEETGQRAEALATFERLGLVAESLDDAFHLAVSLIHRGWMHHQQREYEQAMQMTSRGLQVAQRSGGLAVLAWATINLGEIAFDVGEWEDAQRWFTQALPLGRVPGGTTDPGANLFYLQVLKGDENAYRDLDGVADDPVSWATRYLADWELLTERPAQASDRLEKALEVGIAAHLRRGWIALLAESYVMLGKLEQVETLLSPVIEQPVGAGYPADPIQCCRVMGMLRAAQERWDEAHGHFERALAESEGFPFIQGQVHHHFGVALEARGEREDAREHLDAALTLFDRLGAELYAARTRVALSQVVQP